MHERVTTADEALIARIAAADRDAFAQLFGVYAPKVKAYLLRLGAPATIAEDLAQEAMLSVWRRAASFAVLTFTDGRAVTVQMSTRGSSTASDDAILYQVATSIRLRPAETREEASSSSVEHEI